MGHEIGRNLAKFGAIVFGYCAMDTPMAIRLDILQPLEFIQHVADLLA